MKRNHRHISKRFCGCSIDGAPLKSWVPGVDFESSGLSPMAGYFECPKCNSTGDYYMVLQWAINRLEDAGYTLDEIREF